MTKIFVGLLVILSLILSAATVSTVATLDNYDTQLSAAKAQASTLQASLASSQAKAAADVEAAEDRADTLRTEVQRLSAELTGMESQVSQLNQTIATKDREMTTLTANQQALIAAVQGSQTAQEVLQGSLANTRQQLADLSTRRAELEEFNTDLAAERQQLEREVRNLQEQIAQLRQSTGRMTKALEDQGIDPTEVAEGRTAVTGAAPAINGIIKNVKLIGGKTYAEISVGSEDRVAQNMKFNVVDSATGDFLGVITIYKVEPAQSIGILDGPQISSVSAGDNVLTQF
ncbi:MAG: hypothetical protein AAGD32_17905 [Planctomycetota bacterium]